MKFVLLRLPSREYRSEGRSERWTTDLQKARVYNRKCDLANSAPLMGLRKDQYEALPVFLLPQSINATKETP